MPQVYKPFVSITPSTSDNTYILALAQTFGRGLAVITSADELFVVDQQNLATTPPISFQNVPKGINCLVVGDDYGQSIVCSGTDGTVATFDVRSQKRSSVFELDRAVTALSRSNTRIAVGTEFRSQQAIVSVWDVRQNRQVWQNAENNDEITVVDFHSSRPNIILSGGDDGLVSLFDTDIAEEDDSLIQVINHGPIHKAGFLDCNRVFALSSDQNLSIHSVSTPGDEQDPVPIQLGDLRPRIPCQYVVDILKSGSDHVIAAGTNIGDSRLDLVKLNDFEDSSSQAKAETLTKHTIQPAHGEEIIRATVINDETGVIFTAGEDGQVRASIRSHSTDVKASKPSSKHSKSSEGRYKPY